MKFSLDQLDQVMSTNILIVGRPGTGKTYSIATAHKLRQRKWVKGTRMFYADFDEGVQPVRRLARIQGWESELDIYRYFNSSGDKIKITGDGTANDATPNRSKDMYLEFAQDINKLHDMVGPNGQWRDDYLDRAPYVVVVDSLTSFADDVMSFTLALRGKDLDKGADGRQEYGLQMGKIVETVRSVRSLPCFSIWTAHEQTKAETVKMPAGITTAPRMTGRDWKLPVVTGQLANTIGGEFGIVLYTETENGPDGKTTLYKWYTRPIDNIFCARTRLRDGLETKVAQDFNVVIE